MNRITSIKGQNGDIIEDEEEIANTFIEAYEGIYGQRDTAITEELRAEPPAL